MILDERKLTIRTEKLYTLYQYNFPSDDKKILITLIATPSSSASGTPYIEYYVAKSVKDLDDVELVKPSENAFQTNDLKKAWEYFEDLFEETDKEENPQKQDPEIQVLLVSVEKSGKSYLFLQKQDNSQQLLLELEIADYNIRNSKPQFEKLDFSNESNIPQPFNTIWNLALFDDAKFEECENDCTTYIVALESVDQPGQNEGDGDGEDGGEGKGEGKDDGGEDGGEGKGEGKDDGGEDGGEGKGDGKGDGDGEDEGDGPGETPGGTPGGKDGGDDDGPGETPGGTPGGEDGGDDDGPSETPGGTPGETPGDDGKPKERERGDDEGGEISPGGEGSAGTSFSQIEYTGVVREISQATGLSPDDVESALRTEKTFDTFLALNKVNVNDIKSKLNASDLSRSQFVKQVVKDFQNS